MIKFNNYIDLKKDCGRSIIETFEEMMTRFKYKYNNVPPWV